MKSAAYTDQPDAPDVPATPDAGSVGKIPGNYALHRAIAKFVYANGASLIGEMLDGMRNEASPSAIEKAVNSMLKRGWLMVAGDEFDLSQQIHDRLDAERRSAAQKGEIVPPPAPPVFRPLSAKYIPSAHGTRAEASVREAHFVSFASKVPAR